MPRCHSIKLKKYICIEDALTLNSLTQKYATTNTLFPLFQDLNLTATKQEKFVPCFLLTAQTNHNSTSVATDSGKNSFLVFRLKLCEGVFCKIDHGINHVATYVSLPT